VAEVPVGAGVTAVAAVVVDAGATAAVVAVAGEVEAEAAEADTVATGKFCSTSSFDAQARRLPGTTRFGRY
jgi:hypothetical protein